MEKKDVDSNHRLTWIYRISPNKWFENAYIDLKFVITLELSFIAYIYRKFDIYVSFFTVLNHKTRVTNNLTSSFYDSNVMNRPVKFQLLVSCKEWIFFCCDYLKRNRQRLQPQIYVQLTTGGEKKTTVSGFKVVFDMFKHF